MQDEFEQLRYKLLNQHFSLYVEFSRLLISLSTASLALLAALNEIHGANIAAFAMLLCSMIAGVGVQYRIVLRPLSDLDTAATLLLLQQENETDSPALLRRSPSLTERWMFRIQVYMFVSAFVVFPAAALFLL